jgi:signal transduction histidine kinase
MLDDLGILATLGWFCREFQKDHPGIDVETEFGVEEHEISPALKLVIFRIVQDALKNVALHGGANHIRLGLAGKDRYLGLEMEDNGRGGILFAPCLRKATPAAWV